MVLVPYALFRWGRGVEAVAGMAIALVAHARIDARPNADSGWTVTGVLPRNGKAR